MFIYHVLSSKKLERLIKIVREKQKKHLLVIIDINLRLLPVTSGDLALEHDVNLAVGSALHLRKEEVCSDETEETSGAPNVTTLATDCEILLAIARGRV
jgi:hypothetical protein